MSLPSPHDYENWQDFASALLGALEGGMTDIAVGNIDASAVTGTIPGSQIGGTIPAEVLPPPSPDAVPVYWSPLNSELFLADDFTVPPPVITPFQIDTQSLALASVDLGILAANSVDASKIVDLSIGTAELTDASIINAKIANATILSAKIGDLQVVTAKINDLAVNTAKIANLAVGTAQIADAAITTAKIGSAQIGTAQIGTAVITNALMANASIGSAQIINASIATADIGTAQITSALIGAAQILTALIGDAQIVTAKIGAGQITNALIADATILSAKIANLVIDKVTAGTLNAEIDMGTGLLRFTIGGQRLTIGKGFGTLNQFIMWFGPSMAENLMDESPCTFYLKTDGSAYFGGTLAAGIIKNSNTTTVTTVPATLEVGPFSSNGGVITVVISYNYTYEYRCDYGTGSITGAGSATVVSEKSSNSGGSWASLGSNVSVTEHTRNVIVADPGVQDTVRWGMGGSATYTMTPGALATIMARGRLTARSIPTFGGSGATGVTETQSITVVTTEG